MQRSWRDRYDNYSDTLTERRKTFDSSNRRLTKSISTKSHHANIEVSGAAAREYVNEKIDAAVDIIDLAKEEINELNDTKTIQEEARETVLELSKSRSLVSSHTAIVQEALQELTLRMQNRIPRSWMRVMRSL